MSEKKDDPALDDQILDDGGGTNEDDLTKLREQLAQAQAGRAAAEAETRTARQQAGQATEQAITATAGRLSADEQAAENAIAAADAVIDRAESALADAQQAGDFKAAAKAQRELSEAVSKKGRWEDRKEYLATEREKFDKAPKPVETDPGGDKDAMGNPMSRYTAPSRAWIDRHPKFKTDAAFVEKVARADAQAWGEGFDRDSGDYFNRVEEIIGERQVAQEDEKVVDLPQRRQASQVRPGAPVSSARTPQNRQRQATGENLSEAEKEVAERSFSDLKPKEAHDAYATNKAKLLADGKIGPHASLGR